MYTNSKSALNIDDLRNAARRRLPRGLFEYVDRGAEDELALTENTAAFGKIKLLPRVLEDVYSRDLSIQLFGQTLPMPLIVAPTGSAGLMWYRGEEALAQAAGAADIPFVLAGGSTLAMEEAVATIGKRTWFQLSMWQDIALSLDIMERVKACGIEVLVATVDTSVAPIREYNQRNGFSQPFRLTRRNILDVSTHPRWLFDVALRYLLKGGLPRYQNVPKPLRDPVTGLPARMLVSSRTTWKDFATVRKNWAGILVAKGILSAEDARLAARHGADGIVVSNHGGRNFDSAPASLDVLPGIADAVGEQLTVLFDSGIRRGSDIIKALALGARAVLVGRAPLYGVGAAGEAGASRALGILKSEMETTLGFLGRTGVETLDRSCIHKP